MAFRRKRIKDIGTGEFIASPVLCSFCTEEKALFKIHGTTVFRGGRTCCDDCFPSVKKEEQAAAFKESASKRAGYSEADYQTWLRL